MNNKITTQPSANITCSDNRVTISSQEDAVMGCFRDRVVMDFTLQNYGRLRSTCKSFYFGLYKERFEDIMLRKIETLTTFLTLQHAKIINKTRIYSISTNRPGGIYFDDTRLEALSDQLCKIYERRKLKLMFANIEHRPEEEKAIADEIINGMLVYGKLFNGLIIKRILEISEPMPSGLTTSNDDLYFAIIKQFIIEHSGESIILTNKVDEAILRHYDVIVDFHGQVIRLI